MPDDSSVSISHQKQSFAFSALQTGVKVIIIISMILVVLVIIYAVLYRLCKGRLGKPGV